MGTKGRAFVAGRGGSGESGSARAASRNATLVAAAAALAVLLAALTLTGPAPAPADAAAREPAAAGASSSGAHASIVGGRPTPYAQVPWQVALVENGRGTVQQRQFCGGTLVAPTIVVTAAHCLLDGGRKTPVSTYRVVSGRSSLNNTSEGRSSRVVDSVIWVDDRGRPLYDDDGSEWDVAIVELASPAAGVPIQIAGPDERDLWAPGRLGRVSGWGVTARNPFGVNYLQSTQVALLPDWTCRNAYRGHGGFRPATQTCAGRALGRHDTCQGDSGGPLVAYSADGTPRLVGITSFGEGCARKYFPGVYTRVASDPVRSAVDDFLSSEYGISVVGSGATAPGRLSSLAAKENAWLYLEPDCFNWGPCQNYNVERCRPNASGYRCIVVENAFRVRDGRFHCAQRVLIGVTDGAIFRRGESDWACRRGWR